MSIEIRTPDMGHVDLEGIDRALRLIHLDWMSNGADLDSWLWDGCWFPHLRWEPEILALHKRLPAEWKGSALCDPQIVLQFPTPEPYPEVSFHTDEEPDWAKDWGHRYKSIVGVPLNTWTPENGSPIFKNAPGDYSQLTMRPGGAIMFTPDQLHSPGINTTGQVRYGVYFRWLA